MNSSILTLQKQKEREFFLVQIKLISIIPQEAKTKMQRAIERNSFGRSLYKDLSPRSLKAAQ